MGSYYGIVLRDYIADVYYRIIMLRTHVTESYYEIILRNGIAESYYEVVLWHYITESSLKRIPGIPGESMEPTGTFVDPASTPLGPRR